MRPDVTTPHKVIIQIDKSSDLLKTRVIIAHSWMEIHVLIRYFLPILSASGGMINVVAVQPMK